MGFLLVFIASIAVAYALRPKVATPKPASLADIDLPTAEPGRPIPVVFGEVLLKCPNVVWYGNLQTDKVKSHGDTIGYKYYMILHQILAKKADEVTAIEVGERVAWSGSVTESDHIYIDAWGLFGGKRKEGGIQGGLDILFGESDQEPSAYLAQYIGQEVPAFRGVVSTIYHTGEVCAMSPYPKPWAYRIKYFPGKSWYAAKANIDGSANPVHIIYDVLTDEEAGLGFSELTIDTTSFEEAADTLYDEGFGLSFALTGSDSAEAVIYNIVEQIGAIFYTTPDEGLFAIKLLRDDYVPASLVLYDESSIIKLDNFERPSYAEMVNEIIVQYRPRGTSKDDSVTVQNLASIQAQGGIISETLNYPGIDTYDNAVRAAMRELKVRSTPLARIRFTVNRAGWADTIGKVVKLSWAELGLDEIILRIVSVDTGSLHAGQITIDAVQDVFNLPTSTYLVSQPSEWVDPITTPAPAAYVKVYEAPYQILYLLYTQADIDILGSDVAYLASMVGAQTVFSPSYELWERPSGGEYDFAAEEIYAPHGTLVSSVNQTGTTVILENMKGPVEEVLINQWAAAWLEDEAVTVEAFNTETGAVTIGRGALDTVPVAHAAGARLWFATDFTAVSPTEYSDSATVYARILPNTGGGILGIDDAPSEVVDMVGRANKPYPPANFKVASQQYPTSVSGIFTVTWNHRDRIAQKSTLLDTTEASIGPESTTRYALRFKKAIDSALLVEKLDIEGAVATVTLNYTGNVIIQLYSISDRGESFQMHEYTFNYTPPGGSPENEITAGTYDPEGEITIIDGGEVTP